MIATIDYVERKFKEYNVLMFEGELKQPPFRLSNARTYLGALFFHRTRKLDGTKHYSNFEFRISIKIDRPENIVDDTIIHEMIHYWIHSNQLQDNGTHGDLFRKKMKEINLHFGRNITVTHKRTKEELDKDTERRQHLICVVKMQGDQIGITIATRTKLFRLWDELPKVPHVIETKWYSSTDPFFNRYPRASSIRIYHITRSDLEAHHKDFKSLVREGNIIKIRSQK